MLKKFAVLFLAAVLPVLALSGCATTSTVEGKPIISSSVGKIKDGVTTEKQVISMLGNPYSIEEDPLNGTRTLKYRFYYRRLLHLGSEIVTSSTRKYNEKLDVITKNGIVISHSFSSEGNISLDEAIRNSGAGGTGNK